MNSTLRKPANAAKEKSFEEERQEHTVNNKVSVGGGELKKKIAITALHTVNVSWLLSCSR